MRISDWSSDVCSSDLLAQAVGLSKTPCQVRLRRLIETGVIRGFRAIVDPAKLGMDHVAFAEVKLSDTREKALDEFNAAVRRIPEVEECHMIASSFNYLQIGSASVRGRGGQYVLISGGA